ncbi:MAG: hypothetical protein ABFS10_09320 [Bacteroidota bacterium]
MKYLKITLAITFSLLIMSSCGNNKKQGAQSDDTFSIQDYIKAAEAIEPNMSRVEQVFNILDMVNAEYYDVLTNDPYSAHSYKFTYPIAAANLGIYMTDILYHLYGENNEAMYLSFAAAQELAKHIGVESKFGTWTIENLEGTMMKRDTIAMLFNGLLADSKKYNSDQEMVFIHTAFLTGSFVEKVHVTSNLLKQKMATPELTKEQEGDIRELLVIYLNQLDPSASVLYDAFERQKDQLSGLVVLTTFQKLKELSAQLKTVKTTLAAAPISEIAANKELSTTFNLIENLRTVLITATPQ